jgi:hypothetical protein
MLNITCVHPWISYSETVCVNLNNVNIEEALITEWRKDTSQFMMKVKSTGKSYHTIDDVKIQKVSRYYVSRNGGVRKPSLHSQPKPCLLLISLLFFSLFYLHC